MIKKKEYIQMVTFLAVFSMITSSIFLYYSFERNESSDNIYHLGLLIFWAVTTFLALFWVRIECNPDDDNMINELDTNYMLIKLYAALPIVIAIGYEFDSLNGEPKKSIAFLSGWLGGCFVVLAECAYKRKRRK